MLTYYAPDEAGFYPERLARATALLDDAAARGAIPGAALLVSRGGKAVAPHVCGRQSPAPGSPPLHDDSIFLVASVTKPVTVTASMLLVERGQIMLTDRVADYLPEFGNRGKEAIRIRHLMTHTSGLPDMLPDNIELRRRHAPLSDFVAGICALNLDFPPGSHIQYQSAGLAILAALVERLSGQSLPDFLREELFLPLRMYDTGLGCHGLDEQRIAHINVPREQVGTDWGWNQPYWRELGAPWGGLFTTVSDYYRFMQLFLNDGEFDRVSILSPATVREMTRDQITDLVPLSPEERRRQVWGRVWGLGWVMAGRRAPDGGPTNFGDLLSPSAFGHSGSTGTVVWADPARELICVLFTTEPATTSNGLLGRVSNLVAAAAR
jgi:CubicO group peptidase (beta-lactamase class C family)